MFVGKYYKLFYFFYFFFQPLEFSLSVYFLRYIRNLMTDHVFDCIFIDTIFLSHRDKMFTTVMWSMLRIQV